MRECCRSHQERSAGPRTVHPCSITHVRHEKRLKDVALAAVRLLNQSVAADGGDHSLSLKLAKMWQTPKTFSPSRVEGPRLTFSCAALTLGAILSSHLRASWHFSQAAGHSGSQPQAGRLRSEKERSKAHRAAFLASRGITNGGRHPAGFAPFAAGHWRPRCQTNFA